MVSLSPRICGGLELFCELGWGCAASPVHKTDDSCGLLSSVLLSIMLEGSLSNELVSGLFCWSESTAADWWEELSAGCWLESMIAGKEEELSDAALVSKQASAWAKMDLKFSLSWNSGGNWCINSFNWIIRKDGNFVKIYEATSHLINYSIMKISFSPFPGDIKSDPLRHSFFS